MREIKFRLYQKIAKEMIPWDKVKELYKLDVLDDNDENDIFTSWMQYTGLKDCEGTEIYEGDIVRVNKLTFDNSGPLPENLVVKFYNGMFQLFRGDEYLYGLHLMYIEDGEVIGNIYENQNLTK